jgi:maltose-binding protein MalE
LIRSLHAVAVALVVIAQLVACSSSSDPRPTVVLWHAYAGNEQKALQDLADELNEARTDLRLELVSVPYEAFADKITNAIPNGNGPDLFIFAHDRIGDWVATDLIEPIEFYVDESLADRYSFDALSAMAYQRSLYGLPLAVKSLAMFYRTDLVAKPPKTTDDLIALRNVLGPDIYPLAYENNDLYGHAIWLHGFGGQVFDDSGTLVVDAPESIAALEFARSLGRGPDAIVPPGVTATLVSTLFNEGKVAVAFSGPWFIGDIHPDVPWAVTTLPIVSPTNRQARPFLGAEGVLMSSRAHDKRAAFSVMAYLAGEHAAELRASSARQIVPNLGAYQNPEIGNDPVLAAFSEQQKHAVPMPATPEMRMVWTPYKTALQKVIAQGVDPSDSLRHAADEIRGYLQEPAAK